MLRGCLLLQRGLLLLMLRSGNLYWLLLHVLLWSHRPRRPVLLLLLLLRLG
jgi:hypothetical protein